MEQVGGRAHVSEAIRDKMVEVGREGKRADAFLIWIPGLLGRDLIWCIARRHRLPVKLQHYDWLMYISGGRR